ncbi:hypothetical protein MACJ_002651 [Theileria orientalis]|uniref:TFIID subunit TAF5 NTD2 domain-containing protein n=1 Tax=Theileria orientalis TaxID=68886 RepID=A0A976M6B0_THEOR|nr:hypothetical protein MACJ_002651 [Theileria orientalis]
MTKSQESKSVKSYEFYVSELQTYLNWALSNLNKYKDELIDVGFVIYLELYIKLFKQSTNLGRDFLAEFMNVFNAKYENYISKLLQFKFLDQLDQLSILNAGYNSSSKYIIILSKNCKRILLNWLNIYQNNVINIILMERVEFIDGEMFNHSSVNVFKRYFILKYGIDPESIHKYRKPFLGLYIKDVENDNYKMNSLLIEPVKENKISFGLPCEMYTKDYGHEVNMYSQGINGEFCKMEDFRKLVPLPRPGSLIHESLRSLYQLQAENRNMGQNPYILSYNFANANSINCSTVSDFDGRYAAAGQRDGSIFLWDLVKSQCENAYTDIACILGKDLGVESINKTYPTSHNSQKENDFDKHGFKKDYLILTGHEGLVNCLKFGENGQVLLSGGLDSTINLHSISDGFENNTIKCVYYNSCYPSSSYGRAPAATGASVGKPAGEASGLGESSVSANASTGFNSGTMGIASCAGNSGGNSGVSGNNNSIGNGSASAEMSLSNSVAKSVANSPIGSGTPTRKSMRGGPTSSPSANVERSPTSGSSPAKKGKVASGGSTGGNSIIDLDYSRFGYYFTSCDINGYCKLWATDRSFPVRTLKSLSANFTSSKFHPNSTLLSVISNDNKVNVYDLKSFNSVLHLPLPSVAGGAKWSTLGERNTLGTGFKESSMVTGFKEWNTVGSDLKDLGHSVWHGSGANSHEAFSNNFNGMTWSKNGVILGVYALNTVLLYDVRMGKPFDSVEVRKGNVSSIDFSYSTTLLSVTDTNNELSLWGFRDFDKYMLATDTNGTNKKNQPNKKLSEERLKDGEKKLLKSYKFNKTFLLSSSFTPENVLITLGISAL